MSSKWLLMVLLLVSVPFSVHAEDASSMDGQEVSDHQTDAGAIECKNGGRCNREVYRSSRMEDRPAAIRLVDALTSSSGPVPELGDTRTGQ